MTHDVQLPTLPAAMGGMLYSMLLALVAGSLMNLFFHAPLFK